MFMCMIDNVKSSTIGQLRANPKTGVAKKQSTPNFPKNEHFLPPDMHTCVCVSGVKKFSVSRKFSVLCFFPTPVLGFALLPCYWQCIIFQFCWPPSQEKVQRLAWYLWFINVSFSFSIVTKSFPEEVVLIIVLLYTSIPFSKYFLLISFIFQKFLKLKILT